MTTPSSLSLDQALEQLRSGEKGAAVAILRRIAHQEPGNVRALLWLGGLTPDLEEGIAALGQVLRLDPGNEAARKGLADLRSRQEAQPPPPAEEIITGEKILALAGRVIWTFKDLNRPLGKLVAEGTVTAKDLNWAVRRAYDPTIKWAAAVQIKGNDVRGISLPLRQAREVTWPFKDLNRPIGELLDEAIISLHDLAYAVANARDADVRDASAVMGVEIIRRDGTPPEGVEARKAPPVVEQAEKPSASAAPPAVEPDSGPPAGRLRVIPGSTYLVEQAERKARQRTMLGWGLVGMAFVATVSGLTPLILRMLGVAELGFGWTVAGLGLMGLAWYFLPQLNDLLSEQRNFVAGRKGEDRAARLFYRHLDERWVLFRNVDLPDNRGDIDGVLAGPRGVFALEVKAYTGYNRNIGFKWQRRVYGFWRKLDRNPSRQAKQNAARLAEFLKHRDVDVWVEPRIVWAGSGKLWLERPAVRVWQLKDTAYILEDIEKGKLVLPETVAEIEEALAR